METGDSTGLSTVKVKDITAELVPQQIEMQREASITVGTFTLYHCALILKSKLRYEAMLLIGICFLGIR